MLTSSFCLVESSMVVPPSDVCLTFKICHSHQFLKKEPCMNINGSFVAGFFCFSTSKAAEMITVVFTILAISVYSQLHAQHASGKPSGARFLFSFIFQVFFRFARNRLTGSATCKIGVIWRHLNCGLRQTRPKSP